MKRIFKLGFLGGGLNSIAGYTHFVASQMDKRFEVESGVFSRNPEINNATAEYWNIKRKYEGIDDFIENEKDKLDAMVVLLPTPDHFETVKKLLSYNIPVICEKPLFSSLKEFEEIEDNYNLEGRFLAVTYNYIAYPILSELRKMIFDGNLGKIINIHLEMPQESFLSPPKSVHYPPAWRKKDGLIPGILLDLSSHLFSLSHFITGKKIIKVFSLFKKFSVYDVVDDVKVIADYSDGTTGFFWVSKTALGNRNGLKVSIYGTESSAIWIQEEPEKLYINKKDGTKSVLDRGGNLEISKIRIFNRMTPGHPSGFIEAFANLHFEIANSLETFFSGKNYKENPLIWTFEKEKENFKFLNAVVKSAKDGKAIEVSQK